MSKLLDLKLELSNNKKYELKTIQNIKLYASKTASNKL